MRARPLLSSLAALALALSAVAPAAASTGVNGAPCTSPLGCDSGFCVAGLCCDSACNAPPCAVCAAAAGASADGTCTLLDGIACDDHDPCTRTDTCKKGVCTGADPVICPAPDGCNDAYCDPASDGGTCRLQHRPDNTPCDDGDVCTQTDTCHGGACVGADPVVCPLQADCQTAGVCDPLTGCSTKAAPVCGATPADAGAAALLADGALCSTASACQSGFCVAGICCDSACTDLCHSCALPGTIGQCTIEPEGVDLGHQCAPEGSCLGTCGKTGQCIGSGPGTQCEPARCIDDHRGLGPAECPSAGAACPIAASTPFDCSPYLCRAALGSCAPETCRSVHDCAPGFACDSDLHCTRPPDVASGDDGGCLIAPGSPGGGAVWAALALMAAARRRRRGGGSRP